MRLNNFLNEKLTAMKSGYSWEGDVYRAEDSKNKQEVLGKGMYFTPSEDAAKNYGKKIVKYKIKLRKVLGYNSNEWDMIRRKANYDMDRSITEYAKEQGYDSVYGGEIFGICLFEPKKQVRKKYK